MANKIDNIGVNKELIDLAVNSKDKFKEKDQDIKSFSISWERVGDSSVLVPSIRVEYSDRKLVQK